MTKKLQDVWDYVKNNHEQSRGDIASVERGKLKDKDRPAGECWPCEKLANEGMIHEQAGTAECCKGCDAYKGDN